MSVEQEVEKHSKILYGNGDVGLCEDNRKNKKEIDKVKIKIDKEVMPHVRDYLNKKVFLQGAIWIIGILVSLFSITNIITTRSIRHDMKQVQQVVPKIQKAIENLKKVGE